MPSSATSMKIPHATLSMVRNVRSLLRTSTSRISCQRSRLNMDSLGGPGVALVLLADHLAVAQPDRPLRARRDVVLVGHHQDGDALAVDLGQQIHDLLAGLG